MAVSISLGDNSLLVVEQQVNNAKSLVTKEYVDTKTTFAEAVWAPSFNATSSEAVKKDIKSFKKSALNIIKKVNIVSFKYKEDKESIPQICFIAENTDPLLSGEGRKSMRINSAIGLLLKAVQELNKNDEIFKKELSEIKREKKHF